MVYYIENISVLNFFFFFVFYLPVFYVLSSSFTMKQRRLSTVWLNSFFEILIQYLQYNILIFLFSLSIYPWNKTSLDDWFVPTSGLKSK